MSRAGESAISPPAQLDLFGFRPTPARVRVIPRSPAWRVGHVGLALLFWLAIPIVMWIPPHFPWILTAFALGLYFAIRFARERYTLSQLEGTCPNCGAAQTIAKPMRLGMPHRIYCPNCHQQLLLVVRLRGRDGEAAGDRG